VVAGGLLVSDRSEALDLLRDHPLLALGGDWMIEVFEVPKR
jgi:hypothetical protein